MERINTKGSQWRIWDLHVHTPASYGGDYTTFINNAKKSQAAVIGLNDYCSIQGYEEITKLGGIAGKIIFPVVELRMHNLLNTKHRPNGIRINFHIIFDNDPAVFKKITTWLASLKCQDEKGKNIQLGTATDLSKLTFDFDTVIEQLKEYELFENHSLIWLPYDEYGGIDEIDPKTDGYFKTSLINKAHILGSSTQKQIEFFKWQDEKFSIEQYQEWFDRPKPCIKGSDAHKVDYPFGCLKNQHSDPIEKFCWINADMTFAGLKQIIVEPERVYIGEEPDLLKRVRSNKTKFIKSLSVKKISGVSMDDIWFSNFNVELNSGLVAIIGHKGGGKSAVTDIISLCGNTHQDPSNFAFLTKEKFRRLKPSNLSEKFEASLLWEDGNISNKVLNANPDRNLPERVKYIPQNFLERLCANVESDEFEKELKQIIYSHTPADKRLNKASLDELINYKSSLIIDQITQTQTELSKVNLVIVELENKATTEYKSVIDNQLKLKQGELFAHNSSMPLKPEVQEGTENSKKIVEQLSALREKITKLEEEVVDLQKNKTGFSIKKEELARAVQFFKNLDDQLKKNQETTNEFTQILSKHGISYSDVFTYKIDTTAISNIIKSVTNEITIIDAALDTATDGNKTHQLNALKEQLKNGQEELDKPAKAQQKYLDDLKAWEAKKKEIEGNDQTEGTLLYLQNQLSYLTNQLIPELQAKYEDRRRLASELYSKKLSLIEVRRELFQPVTQFINDFRELKKRYDVKIDVSLELKAFSDSFFNYVTQGRTGTFSGKEDGYKKLQDIIERAQLNSSSGFLNFTEELIDNLKHDKRTDPKAKVDITSQLKKGMELNKLYDFIYGADYLQPVYNLKLGSKTLLELSPGERGALLLIFYLILDNDDIPLIIDQPEENLDNESVYHILVHFIKKVKERRQIIIVTHNPNLAVVCDADQIIHMQIDKENKNVAKFLSGAIEDWMINKSIIDILEGTLPAFNNRDAKYLKKKKLLIGTLPFRQPVTAGGDKEENTTGLN